jgi:hypothetical protein
MSQRTGSIVRGISKAAPDIRQKRAGCRWRLCTAQDAKGQDVTGEPAHPAPLIRHNRIGSIQWLERSPQAIDRAKFAKQFLMPPVMSASPPAVVMAVMAVTPAPAPMMAMTANLNETGAVGSTKVVGTRNRHRGGWQDPCEDRANNNQALSHFYSCSQVADKTRCIQPRRGTLVPGCRNKYAAYPLPCDRQRRRKLQ